MNYQPSPDLPIHDRSDLNKALRAYDDGQLKKIMEVAEDILAWRRRKRGDSPRDRYWQELRLGCGHVNPVLLPSGNEQWAERLKQDLQKLSCLVCVARALNDFFPALLWKPEPLEGVSVKQREFGEQVRLKSLNDLLKLLPKLETNELTGPLALLPKLLAIISAHWWIETRAYEAIVLLVAEQDIGQIRAYYLRESEMSVRQKALVKEL